MNNKRRQGWVWNILLVAILAIAAYFRFVGLDWDNDHHLHPDERFLTMVASSIAPVENPGSYFDTNESSLNPNNRGYGFYVYGTLPLFTVRYIAEWVGQTGYSEVYLVGRFVSAASDLLTIILVFLAAETLYRKRAISILAAAFSAFSVLQIQLSHYFTVDIYANLFSTLTFFFAVRILRNTRPEDYTEKSEEHPHSDFPLALRLLKNWSTVLPYILFGISFGMAVASKISAVPLAVLLPGVVLINLARFKPEEKYDAVAFFIRDMVAAGIVSMVVFRIFQPYAFTGPGFFGFIPNESWLGSLRQLSGQSGGDVDFPPALQWARRPIWFGLQNMVLWGMGLPLGILAWVGFLWMGYRIFKGDWVQHAVIWGWTGIYFAWQSINFTSSMRYFLLIYPMLQIIAAWLIVDVWERGQNLGTRFNWRKMSAFLLGGCVLVSTFLYAFAFSRIYTRPVTRLEASEWIYQNVPGPINLNIETSSGLVNQPVAYPLASEVGDQKPVVLSFQADYDGAISEIEFSHLIAKSADAALINFTVWISDQRENPRILTSATVASSFPGSGTDPRGDRYTMNFIPLLNVYAGDTYYLFIETLDPGSVVQMAGPITLTYLHENERILQPLPAPVKLLDGETDYTVNITPIAEGVLTEIYLPHAVDWTGSEQEKILQINIIDTLTTHSVAASGRIQGIFSSPGDDRGEDYLVQIDPPVSISPEQHFALEFSLVEGEGSVALYGSKQALESTWDDPLPYSMYGMGVFNELTGVYRTELNFEMYWDDNQEKLERFIWILDQADYIFISSSRQWATTVRVPERYPLTTTYYRALMGCPPELEIIRCYAVAEPGQFAGDLGFELVKTFQSNPNLGSIQINSQFAEEAFTVYDHPKVLIFRKGENYSTERVRDLLGAVDLTRVIHLTPKEASNYKGNLVLPEERWAEQQDAGTWHELFDRDSLVNRYPALGLVAWYVVIALLGIIAYPFTRLVFQGLRDRGYPLSRLFGLLVLVYLVWLSGSLGVKFTAGNISIFFLIFLSSNLVLFFTHRDEIVRELKQRWKYFLLVEILFLGVFLFGLFIRLGNPDLWHPYKGGEKPMDFSYLNAVLKSTAFPPYDPWFAGGYINYYYYGFVLVGVPVKWLGIVPSVAYNLILPTLMAFLAMGTFCLGNNLVNGDRNDHSTEEKLSEKAGDAFDLKGLAAGFFTTVFMVFVGNLGTVRMIWHGIMRLAAPGGNVDGNIFARLAWTIKGMGQFLSGASLPYGAGDWYWIPSRVYPNEPITEFPLFTFLYADLHAHLIALPITVLVLCFAISMIRFPSITDRRATSLPLVDLAVMVVSGALVIGALRPTNTWDLPTYLVIGVLATGYAILRLPSISTFLGKNGLVRRYLFLALFIAGLVVLTFVFYQPFVRWYGQAYNSVKYWEGDHSPFWSYLTHWGLFLFVIASWMFWETRNWMASTPVSALRALRPYLGLIQVILVLLLASVVALIFIGVSIGWLVLPLALWAGVLLMRPGLDDLKRVILFLVGTALVLTLVVELVVLEGDIGRMNTVFKFYLQSWTLFSVSAGAALVWLFPEIVKNWPFSWRTAWQTVFALLLGSAALFTLFGGVDKIRDRMSKDAPHTLDGMAYMPYSTYAESGVTMDLGQDYQAILWMQENIQGTPVIVEANTPEYRWGSRYTIYTGLPGVVGWNWHQRQQRAIVTSTWVTDRVDAVGNFYRSLDKEEVTKFLRQYEVEYIVVGQLERAYYAGEGIGKFDLWESDLWTQVYRSMDTTIYRVLTPD